MVFFLEKSVCLQEFLALSYNALLAQFINNEASMIPCYNFNNVLHRHQQSTNYTI